MDLAKSGLIRKALIKERGSLCLIRFGVLRVRLHGLLNYIDTKAKCRHLKKLPVNVQFFRICRTGPPGYTAWRIWFLGVKKEYNINPKHYFAGSLLGLCQGCE